MSENKRGFLSGVKSKTAFWLGLSAGIGVIFVVGFFILLGLFITQSSPSDQWLDKNSADNGRPITAQAQPSGDGEINLQPVSGDDWIRGDVNAPISIVEFSDTECPFCKRFHPTMQQIVDKYDGQVNWVYRHFPLPSLHSKAPKEAEATECAGELAGNNGFWQYLDRLFEITPANNGLAHDQLYEIADYVGLNANKFKACLDSGKYASKVNDQARQAQAAGGTGTPYSVLVIGDQKIPISGAQPLSQLEIIIDSLLR